MNCISSLRFSFGRPSSKNLAPPRCPVIRRFTNRDFAVQPDGATLRYLGSATASPRPATINTVIKSRRQMHAQSGWFDQWNGNQMGFLPEDQRLAHESASGD
jgi:hypothetical protein